MHTNRPEVEGNGTIPVRYSIPWRRRDAAEPALISRRTLLASTGIAALTGCSRNRGRSAASLVSIAKVKDYSVDLLSSISQFLRDHRIDVRSKRVLLKPNLVEFDDHTAINTSPVVVLAAYEAFRQAGASSVAIAEGPGHRRITLDLADAAGYFSTVPHFEHIFTDLNLDNVTEIQIPEPNSKLRSLYLPQRALECDLLVSIAKMKTHHWAGATLSMKNLFGVVPGGVYGWPKNVLHWAGIPETIADLHQLFPNQFAIVDGIVGMEGNGPIQGTPRAAGVLVAGRDPVAVDATCCRVMGIDPSRIEYLAIARGREFLGEESFKQIGETVQSVRTPFQLIEEWTSVRA